MSVKFPRYLFFNALLLVVWTVFYFSILKKDRQLYKQHIEKMAVQATRSYFERDLSLRLRPVSNGGVYVPVDTLTALSSNLTNGQEQNIITAEGKQLKLMNPACITRQLYEQFTNGNFLVSNITSISPKNPNNAPSTWELRALKSFQKGQNEIHEIYSKNNNSFIRLMKPLFITKKCLKCHANENLNVGDVGGGIHIEAPMNYFIEPELASIHLTRKYFTIIWILGLLVIQFVFIFINRRYKNQVLAQHAAIEGEKRYKKLANVTFEGILVHNKGQVIDMNTSLEKMLGYNRSYFEENNFIEKYVHPRNRDLVLKNLEKDYVAPYEVELIRSDGTTFFAELEGKNVVTEGKPSRISAIRDITAKKLADKKLFTAQQNLKFHIEKTPLGVIQWNKNFEVNQWNKAAENIFGYSEEEVIGKKATLILTKEDKPNVDTIWEDLLAQKGGSRGTNGNLTKSGEKIICEWYNTPLMNEFGEVTGVASMVMDITERTKAREELLMKNAELQTAEEEIRASNEELRATNDALVEKMNELEAAEDKIRASNEELQDKNTRLENFTKELVQARKKAEESDQLKSKFLANMSHEIRTPMNAIIGFSQLLGSAKITNERRAEFIDIILNSGEQLLTIVSDILDISKIETGQLHIQQKEVNIGSLLNSLYKVFSLKANERNNELKLIKNDIPDNTLIISDENRLRQVLSNLITNALKFTKNGQIEIGYKIIDYRVRFWVKDNGMGITPENLLSVFDRFKQGKRGLDVGNNGVGLGLSISKGLVELLGGSIWAESVLDEGSLFQFDIPYREAKIEQKEIEPLDYNEIEFSNLTILVAEDNSMNYKVIEAMLEDYRAKLVHAKNGQEAIEAYNLNKDINLVLMDIRMPIIGGYEAAKKLKSINRSLPIIAQTAFALNEEKDLILNANSGFDNYISKPINRDELIQIIFKTISNSIQQ